MKYIGQAPKHDWKCAGTSTTKYWVRLGTDPSKHCPGISGYMVHHANTKEVPALWRRYQNGWQSGHKRKKMYTSEVHCGIATNHRNSKQLKGFNLIYLLILRLSLNACLTDWLQNERSFIFSLKKKMVSDTVIAVANPKDDKTYLQNLNCSLCRYSSPFPAMDTHTKSY